MPKNEINKNSTEHGPHYKGAQDSNRDIGTTNPNYVIALTLIEGVFGFGFWQISNIFSIHNSPGWSDVCSGISLASLIAYLGLFVYQTIRWPKTIFACCGICWLMLLSLMLHFWGLSMPSLSFAAQTKFLFPIALSVLALVAWYQTLRPEKKSTEHLSVIPNPNAIYAPASTPSTSTSKPVFNDNAILKRASVDFSYYLVGDRRRPPFKVTVLLIGVNGIQLAQVKDAEITMILPPLGIHPPDEANYGSWRTDRARLEINRQVTRHELDGAKIVFQPREETLPSPSNPSGSEKFPSTLTLDFDDESTFLARKELNLYDPKHREWHLLIPLESHH